MDWMMIPAVTVIFGGPALGLAILIALFLAERGKRRQDEHEALDWDECYDEDCDYHDEVHANAGGQR